MFKWFSGNKNASSEEKVNNTATARLQSYIAEYQEDDDIEPMEEVLDNKSHLVKPVISQRKEILSQSKQAVEQARKLISDNFTIPNREAVPSVSQQPLSEITPMARQPKKDEPVEWCEQPSDIDEADIDYSDADISTILANLDKDPYADTDELLDIHTGKKYVDVTVVYDAQNTIASRTYRFETPSFTAFHEKWTEELYRLGTYRQQDVTGKLVTINPSKCYTVEIQEFKG